MRYAVIGAGISGLTIARLLNSGHEVVVYESASKPGGLVKCDNVDGSLFHCTGGHVFNTKRKDVLEWFWSQFDREREFSKALRNSVVAWDNGKLIPYPIENHIYQLEEETQRAAIADLLNLYKEGEQRVDNFEQFLRKRFGETLYHSYFQPYNMKVWRRNLSDVPLSWLMGKLPMPTVEEIVYNNMNHVEERTFVHSSFYYPHENGSQFIADRLAESLSVRYNSPVERLGQEAGRWLVNGETFDAIVFCGNVKQLPSLLPTLTASFVADIDELGYHGTTSVFCEIDSNDYSWVYLPSRQYESHRIICTGNFSLHNNGYRKMTATVEFTDDISKEQIMRNLQKMPFSPKYITHHYEAYTYPIQDGKTRKLIEEIKHQTEKHHFYLLGRFAEWEYYNMDAAMGAAMDLYQEKLCR